MMKKFTLILLGLVALLVSSCSNEYVGPPGHSYDPSLVGIWQLTAANGNPVTGYKVNYIQFYAGGTGYYYYYAGGQPYKMRLVYAMNYQPHWNSLYITYADGQSSSMRYHLSPSGSRLYMRWYDHGQLVSYTYTLVNDVPYSYTETETVIPDDLRPGKVKGQE